MLTYTVRPPQPTSLEITPSTVRAGSGSFTMTVGNGAGVTLDYRYTLNGGTEQESSGWPSLEPVSEDSGTGQVDVDTGPCTAVGNYVFTSIRNTLNAPWVSVSGAEIEVTAPPAPVVTEADLSSARAGNALDITLSGSNLCHISLSSSVTGITFSDLSYDGVTGTSAGARIQLASSTPTGTATITLSASGGSTSFSFTVEGAAAGAPVVDRVSPRALLNSPPQRILTLEGSHLNDVNFEVVTTPAEEGDSKRFFPTVSFHSQDPSGTWLKLAVDADDESIFDFYNIRIWNNFGEDEDGDVVFRIVPPAPLIDYWTPSNPQRGETYVLSLVGDNLQNALITVEDRRRLSIFSVDNSEDNRLNALMEVLDGAPTGLTDVIVRNQNNRETRVSIDIRSATTVISTGAAAASSGVPSERNVTADLEAAPPLYLQQFRARGPTPSSSQALSHATYFTWVYNLAEFVWQLPLIYCPSLGRFGPRCLTDLFPGQLIDVRAYVLSLYLKLNLRVIWRVWPTLSYPRTCGEIITGAQIPGLWGFAETFSYCFNTGWWGRTLGNTNSISITGGNCLQVQSRPNIEKPLAEAFVIRTGCCEGEVLVSARGTSFIKSGVTDAFGIPPQPFAFNTTGVGLAVTPPGCVDTSLEIDDAQNHANILFANGTMTTTLSVSCDPPSNGERYLRASFGSVQSPVTLSNDGEGTSTYTAGTLPENSNATTAANVEVSNDAPANFTTVDSVTVFNYRGFPFNDLPIAEREMIVRIPASWSVSTVDANLTADAGEIQRFLQQQDSFLARFYLNTKTQEGFFDQDGDGSFDSDSDNSDRNGDILYEAPDDQNPAGDSTRGNNRFDDYVEGEEEQPDQYGETIPASTLIARAAWCTNVAPGNYPDGRLRDFYCNRRSHQVKPRNMLVTLQKERSVVGLRGYPTDVSDLNDAME